MGMSHLIAVLVHIYMSWDLIIWAREKYTVAYIVLTYATNVRNDFMVKAFHPKHFLQFPCRSVPLLATRH